MSKLFAPDDPDKLRPVEEREPSSPQVEQLRDLKDTAFARLYESDKIAERFVGRIDEMAKLKRWVDLALARQGKPVFIIGDAGIGKTELTRRLLSGYEKPDILFLTGRYFDIGSGAPYDVFLNPIQDLVAQIEKGTFENGSLLGKSEIDALSNCLKDIKEILTAGLIQETENERAKYRTFELLAKSYLMLADARPVILFLDDLQWADELSLEFLAYLIRALQNKKLFLICTVREHEISLENHPLRTWMRRMSRYNAYEQLKLHPLNETETESLIGRIFSSHAFIEDAIKLLHRETGGNPYYLLEIIKQLIEDKKIYFEKEAWRCARLEEVRLPKSLVDLTELQLGRIDKPSLEIFEKAAVIGEEFSFAPLLILTGLEEDKLSAAIEKGIQKFLIREETRSLLEDSERYAFIYNTTRKVLYERLSRRQRRALHLKIAEFLEEHAKNRPSGGDAGKLAYHFNQAGETERAFYWSVEAGALAETRYAFDQGKKFLDWAAQALDALTQAGKTPDAALLAGYGSAHGRLKAAFGEYEEAVELLRRARNSYNKIGEKAKEAETLLSLAAALKSSNSLNESLKAYADALKIARELDAPHLKWQAAFGAARCETELGNPELALELLEGGLVVLDMLSKRASEAERERIESVRTEFKALLAEVEAKIGKARAKFNSGKLSVFDAKVGESSSPEKASRVLEITVPATEVFKKYALWFKQLHTTSELLNKLSKSPLSPPLVVGLIFSGLKQLKGRIDEYDPIELNSRLALIEKQLREYQCWLQVVNEMLPPYTIRQYLDQGLLSEEEMMQLARFMAAVESEARDDKGKIELLLTRALDLETDRRSIIESLFPLDKVYASPPEETLNKLHSIMSELDSITNYSDFITSNLTNRVKEIKAELGQLFWHPHILAAIIDIDLKLDFTFREMLEKEQHELVDICDHLFKSGVRMIPRSGQAGALDVDAAKRMAERAKDLLKSNYESNLPGLLMLAEVGRFLRAHLQEEGILIPGEKSWESPFVDVDRALSMQQGTPRSLPPPAPSASVEKPSPEPTSGKMSSKFSVTTMKPFVGDSSDYATAAASDSAPQKHDNEQFELKLQSRLAEICILLATKLRDAPVKVLQLRRSQLAVASWEVDALLSTEDEPVKGDAYLQNQFIRRSVALLSEMQEVGISCREALNAGNRKEAVTSLAMAVYFLEQAKIIVGELETQSHRERDSGQYSTAQNLAATRQKLMSTHQLLGTLVGWLKREMEKS